MKSKETLIQEIADTEKSFAEMAAKEGVGSAFVHFAAEDAVLSRGNQLIKGKAAIKAYFEAQHFLKVKLSWHPDFIDVAASGDLGYTYGAYQFSAKDSSGTAIHSEGTFHTVWKRQDDGNWRFVWD